MMALAAANELPDVFMTKGSWVQNFYDSNLMADLNPYIDYRIYRNGLRDPLMRAGKLLAVPIQFALTSLVYWNEPMWRSIGFNEFPKTWDELVRADQLFKAQGVTTIAHGNRDKWMFESCILSALGDRFTGTAWTNSIIANDKKAKFTDPDFVTSLRYSQQMASMFNRDFNAINNEQADIIYGSGRAASIIEGSWTINFLLVNGDPEIVKNTKYAILPSFPGMKGDPNATSGGAWGMSASSKLSGDKLKAAALFLDYVSGKEYSQYMMDYNGSLGPCVAQINNRSSMPELSRNFIDYISTVKIIPIYDIQMDGAVIDVMNSRLQELLGGTLSPEALGAAIQAEQDKLR
jgi:ABC-type glycerol-3-phosphate transport system substrate-binding protein